MATIENWSTTAASNNSAAPDGAPEGMPAGDLNNTVRENMAQIKTLWGMPPHTIQTTKSTNYTTLESDRGSMIPVIGVTTITLISAVTVGYGYTLLIRNNDAADTATIDPDGAETINGNATQALAPSEWMMVWSDGNKYHGVGGTL